MSTKGNLPLASKKQEYIDGLGNAHEWTNADTCVKGGLMFLDIVEVNPEDAPHKIVFSSITAASRSLDALRSLGHSYYVTGNSELGSSFFYAGPSYKSYVPPITHDIITTEIKQAGLVDHNGDPYFVTYNEAHIGGL